MKRMVRTVQELSAEEKLRLICGKDFWHTDDLGGKIPQITVADGPSGLRIVKERAEDGAETAYPAAAYPAISLLANTWNRAAAAEMGGMPRRRMPRKGRRHSARAGREHQAAPPQRAEFRIFFGRPRSRGRNGKGVHRRAAGGRRRRLPETFLLQQSRIRPSEPVERGRRTDAAGAVLSAVRDRLRSAARFAHVQL